MINVFLLIEQCSLVLYLGRVSKSISQEMEERMFGVNLIMILIFQEKDQVLGEIKLSIIPLALNNGYMLVCNLNQLRALALQQLGAEALDEAAAKLKEESGPLVNKAKVLKSIFWFFVSLIGYFKMEVYHQGLDLQSSKEMFCFSAWETLFLVSMAMSYFYSWQTYSVDQTEVAHVGFRECINHFINESGLVWERIMSSNFA